MEVLVGLCVIGVLICLLEIAELKTELAECQKLRESLESALEDAVGSALVAFRDYKKAEHQRDKLADELELISEISGSDPVVALATIRRIAKAALDDGFPE